MATLGLNSSEIAAVAKLRLRSGDVGPMSLHEMSCKDLGSLDRTVAMIGTEWLLALRCCYVGMPAMLKLRIVYVEAGMATLGLSSS